MSAYDIIVVGTSAGGVEALQILVGGLPCDSPASDFIVLHLSPTGPSFLDEILTQAGPPSRPLWKEVPVSKKLAIETRIARGDPGVDAGIWRRARSHRIPVRSVTGCWYNSRTETSPAFAAIRAMHIRYVVSSRR
jgi:hypothetical protein